ncbi:MAG: sigma-70 family RNA polymerase sigma factor [Ignavibacteriaceae bacterium]|jgi:RNA polymerase sigma-70 factor (ECF subfamily)|nr:sigma-70 family RNA polymerase sigma factor [Ignavibacteriaceae bacterium]
MTSVGTQTDAEIMLKLAGYDSKALKQLYDRYSTMLYALIRKIIPNKERAEEVLADVFVITWKQIDQFDFKSNNVFTWLVTLARNKAVDAMKRELGKEKREYSEEYEKEEILPKLSPEIKAIEFVDVTEMREKVKAAINSLAETQKSVIDLSYYEGLDENVIAERLKIPVSSVKSKLHLANNSLTKQIFNDRS